MSGTMDGLSFRGIPVSFDSCNSKWIWLTGSNDSKTMFFIHGDLTCEMHVANRGYISRYVLPSLHPLEIPGLREANYFKYGRISVMYPTVGGKIVFATVEDGKWK